MPPERHLRERLASLLARVRPERLTTRLTELVALASVNPFGRAAQPGEGEGALADYVLQALADLNLVTGRAEVAPGRPNVWGTLPGQGNGPHLALVAHLDTVGVEGYPAPFSPQVAAGRLYGRGACDMKAALAAYLEVLAVLTESAAPLTGSLSVVGLVDEEHLMIGSRTYPEHGPKADLGLIGEPTGLVICPAHRGQLVFEVTAHGQAAHSSHKTLGRNAITMIPAVLAMLEAYDHDLAQRSAHPLCSHASCSPNLIRGGTAASVVPQDCTLTFDLRQLPGTDPTVVQAELAQRLQDLEHHTRGARYSLKGPIWNLDAHEIPADSAVVQALMASYRHLFGQAAQVEAFPAATDAPYLGFPTVICGPGNLAQAHTTDEWVDLAEVVDATRLYLTLLLELGVI